MRRFRLISIACSIVAAYGFTLMGCATTGGQTEFYTAQQEYMLASQNQVQKPLFEMKASEGKSIENLSALVVYMPSTAQVKDFKQYVELPHPGWETANTVIKTAGTVLGIWFIAEGVKSIFGNFTSLANAPKSVTTTNTNYSNTVSGTGNSGYLLGPTKIGSVSGSGHTVGGGIFQTATPTVVEPTVYYPPTTP
jgi:hypothetical protein